MNETWLETSTGYFYPKIVKLSSAIQAKLQMLISDDVAVESDEGITIPFEKSVLLSNEDAELLKFPPRNPYRISIRTLGTLGNVDFRFILEIMRPSGENFVSPKINGALLHTDSETTYRLNAAQYELVRLTQESNKNIANLDRRQAESYSYENIYNVQKYAGMTDAKVDNFLSAENIKIVKPDGLDVEFQETYDGNFQVQPVLLVENADGKFIDIETKDFQEAFKRHRDISSMYMDRNRTRYICSDDIKQGLQQIKSVPKINKADKERYSKQPKELFSGDVFHFDVERTEKTADDSIAKTVATENTDWLSAEGEFSDRVVGIEEVAKSNYLGTTNAHKTDWLDIEGLEHLIQNLNSEEMQLELSAEENFSEVEGDENKNSTISTDSVIDDENFEIEHAEKLDEFFNFKEEVNRRNKIFALKIKPNFDRIDYKSDKLARLNTILKGALLPSVKLLNHQKFGVNRMFDLWKNGANGILLADDMGLGKTIQTLAFIAGLKNSCSDYGKINSPVLIVAPTALLANWKSEYEKFVQQGIFNSVTALHGQNLRNYMCNELTPNQKRKLRLTLPNDTLALTTYETLHDYQFSFAEVYWSCIIADEVQKIKNPSTGITTALKAMQYDYAIGLSGTPVENSWIDLWSIMDFIQPAWLGDLKTFKETYIQPISKDSSFQNIESVGKKLKENLGELFLRRMKSAHYSDIPKKKIFNCREEMPDYQKRCYFSIFEKIRRGYDIHPLKVIAALRDISLHPDLATKSLQGFFDMSPDEIILRSARLKKTFSILEEVKSRGEKAIIFVVSRKMQVILVHLIEQKFNIKMLQPINGTMNGTYRQKNIDEFNQSEGFNVLVLSPEAAGVGFTITSANNVIHLSRTWNPAKEDQATDRAYRIGQKKDVNVYLIMACHKDFGKDGSFDEKLNALLNYKRKLSENVLFPTDDSKKDGMAIFQSLKPKIDSNLPTCRWSIEDVDSVTGDTFEQIITDLYNNIAGFKAVKTPHSNDNGADVVVTSLTDNSGLLIQCKLQENPFKSLGQSKKAVQEVYTSVAAYQKIYPSVKFKPTVVTNAISFTPQAIQLAAVNNVKLISRKELANMLTRYEVLK